MGETTTLRCTRCYTWDHGSIAQVLCSRLGWRQGMQPCGCTCGHGGAPIVDMELLTHRWGQ